jgi:hypothetical protein
LVLILLPALIIIKPRCYRALSLLSMGFEPIGFCIHPSIESFCGTGCLCHSSSYELLASGLFFLATSLFLHAVATIVSGGFIDGIEMV